MLKRWSILSAVVGLLLLTVAPAAAGPKGTDRPFKADLVGEVTFEPGSPVCADLAPVETITESWGHATHMGNVWAEWSHCPQEVGFINGHATFYAANGDQIDLYYEELAGEFFFPITTATGTGRFEGVSVSLFASFGAEPQFLPGCEFDPDDPLACFDLVTPWPWWGTIEGTISY